MSWTAVMDENGAVALPAELLERLDYRPGIMLDIIVEEDGLFIHPSEVTPPQAKK